MIFEYEEMKEKLGGKYGLFDFLFDCWYNYLDGGRVECMIWDLVIIDVVINLEWIEEVEIKIFKENYSCLVYYIKDIDEDKMRSEFFDIVFLFLNKK